MTDTLLWFRQDLRLADNPALLEALTGADRLIPVYIDATDNIGTWSMGSASRWWLHHSLLALDVALREMGSRLVVLRGPCLDSLRGLIATTGATRVCWNRVYEPDAIARDTQIKRALREDGIAVDTFNGSLLHEPWTITREKDRPYRVFTPYWKAVEKTGYPPPLPSPVALPPVPADVQGIPVDALRLLPKIPWDHGLRDNWRIGPDAAHELLESFLDAGLSDYAEQRDRPDRVGTSRLSPYLHFGEISPRQIVAAVTGHVHDTASAGLVKAAESYVREVVWREFAHHLLYHFPDTPDRPLDERFDRFAWRTDYGDHLLAWQQGRTGYPLVDAGMRELWRTGWMHNRVRMVVASFLTKNLLIPWQEGARWFWETLVDADLASNTFGWQWTAGCGADAAPYFRVFNPVLQGERFDPHGDYVRLWVPELAAMPDTHIHEPWLAPADILAAAGVDLGVDYPLPIVDLAQSRNRALAVFAELKVGENPT